MPCCYCPMTHELRRPPSTPSSPLPSSLASSLSLANSSMTSVTVSIEALPLCRRSPSSPPTTVTVASSCLHSFARVWAGEWVSRVLRLAKRMRKRMSREGNRGQGFEVGVARGTSEMKAPPSHFVYLIFLFPSFWYNYYDLNPKQIAILSKQSLEFALSTT